MINQPGIAAKYNADTWSDITVYNGQQGHYVLYANHYKDPHYHRNSLHNDNMTYVMQHARRDKRQRFRLEWPTVHSLYSGGMKKLHELKSENQFA